eukprot:GHVH01008722.1.p1 GENE.GHVH01008722.1~~GHVH01008722.1.p1  ORF type:complete len:370 (+),score=30.41 GHVH01008722.1:79-1188(+)
MFKLFLVSAIAYSANGIDVPITSDEWNFAADVENPNWEAIIMRNADMTLVYSGSDMMQEEGSLRGDGKVKFWTDAQETVTDENGITSIPIAFDSSYHADARAWILRAITHLADRMGCIKFVQRNDQTRYIRFVDHASDGCQSYVGVMRDEIPTEVRLGGGCMQTRTIIHETLHALGYGHTSNRSDRDKHVRVIWENIEDQFLHAFEKSVDPSVPVTPYDCQNIMHLGSDSLNKLGSDTLRSIDGCHLETNWMRALQYGIQYRDSETIDKQMSQNDVVGAQEMYCPSRIVRTGMLLSYFFRSIISSIMSRLLQRLQRHRRLRLISDSLGPRLRILRLQRLRLSLSVRMMETMVTSSADFCSGSMRIVSLI